MEYIYISQLIRYSKQLYVARQHSSSTCIWSIYLSVDSIFQTFICSNIPTTPAYGVYISQLIRYSRHLYVASQHSSSTCIWSIIYISQLIRYSRHLYVASQHSSRTCIWSIYLSVDSIFQTFICSNIPAAPAYGVYLSQLIRYSRHLYVATFQQHLHIEYISLS
jgi:uncharacterized membrane protein (DUF485 family)